MNYIYLFMAAAGVTGIGAILCLIFIIIHSVKKKRFKPLAITCGILSFLFVLSSAGVFLLASRESFLPWYAAPRSAAAGKDTSGLSDRERFILTLAANPNITAEAAASAYDVLKDGLGFENITAEQNMREMLFDVAADDYKLRVVVSDRLYMVICGNYSLYQDHTVIYTKEDLENRKIDSHDTLYYKMAKEAVTSDLKYPTTAKFCTIEECQMQQNGDYVVVTGYVDAKNSFNVLVRNSFTVELKIKDLDAFSYETVYLNIDGDKSGNYVDIK